jgi:hypothetical protein
MTADQEEPLSRIVVLADDLSGALASAASLAEHFGERVPVVEELSHPVPARLAVNTRARAEGVRPEWIRQTTAAVWESGTRLFDKRIDSTLRGPVAEELLILVASMPIAPIVIAVPAYPGAGRTTRGGQQWRHGTPVGRVAEAMGADAVARQIGGTVVESAVRTRDDIFQAHNPGPYVMDVRHRPDLQTVADTVNRLRRTASRPIVLVSSGELLRYVPRLPPRPLVVVWGSGSPENERQLRHLLRASEAVVVPLWDTPDPSITGRVRVLKSRGVVKTPGPATDTAMARRVLEHLHLWEAQGFRPKRLVISGGDTAQAVFRESGAEGVLALYNPAPLVGAGVIQGGVLHGLELITKGGKVGSPDILLDLVERGLETPSCPRGE